MKTNTFGEIPTFRRKMKKEGPYFNSNSYTREKLMFKNIIDLDTLGLWKTQVLYAHNGGS